MTCPGGIESTISSTRETKSSLLAETSEGEHTELLAILGLALDLETEAREERLGAVLARLPQRGELFEPALAGLVSERKNGKASDTVTLRLGGDVHAPDATAELFLSRIRIKIAANEAHDRLTVEHHSRPRRCRVEVVVSDRVRRRSDESLLPATQRQIVR